MRKPPGGWVTRPLGDLVDVLDNVRIPVSAKERAGRLGAVPYYGATGQVGWIDESIFNEPLILLGEDGVQFFDKAKRKAYLIDGPSWVNNHAHVLRVKANIIDRRFLHFALNNADYEGFANGTTRLKLTQAAMRQVPIPVPSLAVQRRLVEVLEDHISHLDSASAGLRKSLQRISAYQSSSLTACREGNEQVLAEVTVIQGGIQKQQKRAPRDNAYPFLRVANVTAHGLELGDVHRVELFAGELQRLRLEEGDLLVVEGNGSPSQIGRAALWDGSIDNCVHQNHLIRVRALPGLDPSYLEAVWNSPKTRSQLTELASSSSGLHTLSVSKLKSLRIPIPSMERQQQAVRRVDEMRERSRRLKAEVLAAEERASRLRLSLLSAAFTGRLTGRSSDVELAEEVVNV